MFWILWFDSFAFEPGADGRIQSYDWGQRTWIQPSGRERSAYTQELSRLIAEESRKGLVNEQIADLILARGTYRFRDFPGVDPRDAGS